MSRWLAVLIIAAAVAALWMATMRPADGPGIGIGRFSLEQLVCNVVVSCLALPLCYVVLGRRSWKRRAKHSGGAVLVILLAWLLVEMPAAMGLVDYGAVWFHRKIGGDGPNLMQLDSQLLFRHPPYDHFVVRQSWDETVGGDASAGGFYEVEYRYDKNGFRNPRDFQQASVVLVGDSFVEGYLVPQERICATQLGRILGVDVCNLGQNDYGPAQELVVLQRYAVDLRPRVVVWFFFEENDLFDLEDYELIVGGWRRYFVRPGSFASRSFCLNALHCLGRWMERVRWHDSLAMQRQVVMQSQSVRLLPEIPGGEITMHFDAVRYKMPSGRFEGLLTKTQSILQEAQATCRQNDVEFLVVYTPEAFRVYRDLCAIAESSLLAQREINDLPERLGRWCAATGTAYLDLTPALKSAARKGSLVYIPGDVHWSRQGNAVAAEEVAEFIRRAGWLDSK